MTLNPLSTLNNVGLLVRPQHSPYPCYTHVLVRCWRGGTIPVHRTLASATEHRLIERWVEQNWALAVPLVLSEDKAPMIVPMPTRAAPK